MAIRHEHETWINTFMTKLKLYARTKELAVTTARQGGARSKAMVSQLHDEADKIRADLENSLYWKLDEVSDEAEEKGRYDAQVYDVPVHDEFSS